MIFKKNYIFIDTEDKQKIKILRNFKTKNGYFIEFLNLYDNKKDYALRNDLLYYINIGKLKFFKVAK